MYTFTSWLLLSFLGTPTTASCLCQSSHSVTCTLKCSWSNSHKYVLITWIQPNWTLNWTLKCSWIPTGMYTICTELLNFFCSDSYILDQIPHWLFQAIIHIKRIMSLLLVCNEGNIFAVKVTNRFFQWYNYYRNVSGEHTWSCLLRTDMAWQCTCIIIEVLSSVCMQKGWGTLPDTVHKYI